MLNYWFQDQLALGAAQAAVTILLVLAIMLLTRRQALRMERDLASALARGLVQIVAVGSVLVLLLEGPGWTSALILAAMMLAAAAIANRRARGIPGAFQVSLAAIGFGSGVVIVLMTWLGVIDPAVSSLIPVGSMLVANSMNTCALALDRLYSEINAHAGQIEAGLSLGATPNHVIVPYVRSAVRASLIPRVDALRALGIVWIPGLMAGMVLAGSDPVYAALYQFVVIAMIFAAAGLTALASTLLIRQRIFSPAGQLLLRPQADS